jgi:hypothetical protein
MQRGGDKPSGEPATAIDDALRWLGHVRQAAVSSDSTPYVRRSGSKFMRPDVGQTDRNLARQCRLFYRHFAVNPRGSGRTAANGHDHAFAGSGHARISANPAKLSFNRLASERSSVQSDRGLRLFWRIADEHESLVVGKGDDLVLPVAVHRTLEGALRRQCVAPTRILADRS